VGFFIVFLLLGLVVWLVVRSVMRRREVDRLISSLTSRVWGLENQLKELDGLSARIGELERQAREREPGAVARPEIAPAETPAAPPAPAAREAPPPTAAPPPIAAPSAPPLPPAEVPGAVVPPPASTPPASPPRDLFGTAPPPVSSAVAERLKSVGELEQTVGANWLSKLGVIILVLGIAFFLAYQLRTLGPAGKILVGYAVGAALLGLGIFFERSERYRLVARAGIGGGWALLFFTTYAMYHVQASRVLSSETVDLALMLLVAAAMVVHTLRYRSQVVTGIAFLLGFLTVTISHVNVYSLAAGAVLALALVVVVVRMRWFEMEVFGISAAFLNHYLWLRPVIAARGPHPAEFPGYLASSLLLTFYWLVFRCSYVARKTGGAGPRMERVSSVAALLNAGLYIWLMGYQSAHPELAFQFFLFVGAVELGFGQLPLTRLRRTAFLILTTLGVTLLVAAFPYKFSGSSLSVYWLAEAEALFLAGSFTRELVFRRLAMATSLVVAGQLIAVNAAKVMGQRIDGAHVVAEPRMAVIFAFAAALFYFNAIWLKRGRADFAPTRYDALAFHLLSYAGGVLLFLAAWLAFLGPWTAVMWSALALGLAYGAQQLGDTHVLIQANFLAVAAVDRVLMVNLYATETFHHVTLRLITVPLVVALLYLFSRWSGLREFAERRLVASGYTWLASGLASLLLWHELRPVAVALAWTLFGLLLLELGVARRSVSLRLQGYVALSLSFLRIFFVNLNAGGLPGHLSPRLYTTVPLALAFFYVYRRLTSAEIAADDAFALDRRLLAPQIHSFFGTIAVLALLRFEMDLDWVAAAWAAFALVLVALAWRGGRRIFLDHGFLVAAAVLFRTITHNFYERSYFPAPFSHSPWLCAGVAIALLLSALPMAFALKGTAAPAEGAGRLHRAHHALHRFPEQVFFFAPFTLLTLLLAVEMRKGMVTVAWGVEAVAVFLFALWVEQRSFRLAGLGLLLVCVGKILLMDVWRMQPRDRYITFIALGCALLLVSFLYTRYRETLRQYL
jgi:uncharacterized membrane protein